VLAFVSLIASGIVGAWLTGLFDEEQPAHYISASELWLAFFGFLIFIGSVFGILFLIRQNMRSMNQKELIAWEIVRKNGKRTYIRNGILRGFILALLSTFWWLLSDYWKAKSFSLIFNSLWIYVTMFLVLNFAAYYAAIRTWDANERDYQALAQSRLPKSNSL